MAVIEGGDLMLFVESKSLAFATNHTLSISTETSDTSHKDVKGSWTTASIKTFSWEVSTENLYADEGNGSTFDVLFDAMTSKTLVTIVFGQNTGTLTQATSSTSGGWATDTTKNYYTGQAYITSLEVNAPNGDNATFTATFTGVGELSHPTE